MATAITLDNFRDMVWPLPVSDLLYVDPTTTRKLSSYGIHTIGDLAKRLDHFLRAILGKNGVMLRHFAGGPRLPTVAVPPPGPHVRITTLYQIKTQARAYYSFSLAFLFSITLINPSIRNRFITNILFYLTSLLVHLFSCCFVITSTIFELTGTPIIFVHHFIIGINTCVIQIH